MPIPFHPPPLYTQVQHAGRLVTIFSASNYCGRIGNTGGTMLLTPALDYQLMEHWAPSVAELLKMDEEEAAARVPAPVEKPAEARESFKSQVRMARRFWVEGGQGNGGRSGGGGAG